jgi:alkylated DNA repair dioxygenase AlkB
LKELYLPAGKDYAFATFESSKAASTAVTNLNGVCVQEQCTSACAPPGSEEQLRLLNPKLLSGPPLHLYLCFVDRVPRAYTHPSVLTESVTNNLPPGLVLIEEFVSEAEERELLDFFSAMANSSDDSVSCGETPTQEATHQKRGDQLAPGEADFQTPENFLRHRYVKHFGYEFLYATSNVDPDCPLPGGLPAICRPLLKRMRKRGMVEEESDQLTVNHYQPGAGMYTKKPWIYP